ncbi:MAG: sigma-70 family RNA polymerase sigma factor [Gemmatimonadota bacterium]
MLPHLDAAYNLARYLTRNEHDAEDVVQEAYVRALRYFDAFRGQNAKAWLLAIVRHTTYTRRRRDRLSAITTEFNDEMHSSARDNSGPEAELDRAETLAELQSALGRLPPQFREVLVLRELEGLSYEEIGLIVRAPAGTVMSRLSRARARLAQVLSPFKQETR